MTIRAPDQAMRDAAVAERTRNVLIDAGAGTGKTSIVVERLVGMVAPLGDEPPVRIDRIAAVTFTRKAAGELRFRIREKLLAELGAPVRPRGARLEALRNALGGLDTAFVGTIHAFADRLLRRRPMEARLSPGFEVVEDSEALVAETYATLLHAAENHSLRGKLLGTPVEERAEEAEAIILDAIGGGLRAESVEMLWGVRAGLDALVAGFLERRDAPPTDPSEGLSVDLGEFHALVREFSDLVAPLEGDTGGVRFLRRAVAGLRALRNEGDPVTLLREIPRLLKRSARTTLSDTFGGDQAAWGVWKALDGDGRKKPVRATALRDDILEPLRQWFGRRLVRLFPVVNELYRQVKRRDRAVDQIDLLLELRDLLRDRKDVRAAFQQIFDHVFVDEFQDTDPLQAEIVAFLCEHGAKARHWADVELTPGKLTIVGDPKQSIYRFRRADIETYDRARGLVAAGPHLAVTLSANFRSRPRLVDWLNDRFEVVLGASDDGRLFDGASGKVFHQPLEAGLADESAAADASVAAGGSAAPAAAAVHILPFELGAGAANRAPEYRELETEVLPQYLRWLVERSGVRIRDPEDGALRPVGYGDVAVLALSTANMPPLLGALDTMDVPYAARGGRLFLGDEIHRLFLLALRAIGDRNDGVAEAALLRPPFFAVGLDDVVRALRGGEDRDPAALGTQAVERVRELRRQRFSRSVGETARRMIDETAFGRWIATRPNGEQRLDAARELAHLLDCRARDEGLDYDAATVRLRAWVEHPVQLDPPHAVGREAVQVMTVHQAKGLEFPVVVLWDARTSRSARVGAVWRTANDGKNWTIALDGFALEEPAGADLNEREKRYLEAERLRLLYVAATRARDLLVVPQAGSPKSLYGPLWEGPDENHFALDPYRAGEGARWSNDLVGAPTEGAPVEVDLDREVEARWAAAVETSSKPVTSPLGVSASAHRPVANDAPTESKRREGRHGPGFGDLVHRAIALAVERRLEPLRAVALAASCLAMTDIEAYHGDAVADVTRAITTLGQQGWLENPAITLRFEYPLAGVDGAGQLLTGFADLMVATGSTLDVVDFKTDAPPQGSVAAELPAYVEQAGTYGRLATAAGLAKGRAVRRSLLFTANGALVEV